MNTELIRRVADRIEQMPSTFDMTTFAEVNSCGTIACVAGHVVWMEDPVFFNEWTNGSPLGTVETIGRRAQKLLEISYHERDQFFAPNGLLEQINEHRNKVPAMLRWMADNDYLHWPSAANAVGVELR
jgi:hypothetical protein